MHLDIVYIYVHSKCNVFKKAKTSNNLERREQYTSIIAFNPVPAILCHPPRFSSFIPISVGFANHASPSRRRPSWTCLPASVLLRRH